MRILFSLVFIQLLLNCTLVVDASANNLGGVKKIENVFIDRTVNNPEVLLSTVGLTNDNTVFHLFTHGKLGQLLIDGQWKSGQELIIALRTILNSKGYRRLNIYGEFGKGTTGQLEIQRIIPQIGIPISASDDITGKDGDLDLEIGTNSTQIKPLYYPSNLQFADGDDFDGDGMPNGTDLDNDHDAKLDAAENLTCYLSKYQNQIPMSLTSGFLWNGSRPLTATYDQNTESVYYGQLNGTNQASTNKTLLEFTLSTEHIYRYQVESGKL